MSSTLYTAPYKLAFMEGTLGARIQLIMETFNVTKAALARAAGVSPTAAKMWLDGTTGEIKGTNALQLAKRYGLSTDWIMYGRGEMRESGRQGHIYHTGPGPELKAKVPVISWEAAGSANLGGSLAVNENNIRKYCPVDHTDDAYALVMRDNSMTSNSNDSIPEGFYIFVDPGQRDTVKTGDLVLARVKDSVAFRALAESAGTWFLKPLNAQYPPIYSDFTILGKVIFYGKEPG